LREFAGGKLMDLAAALTDDGDQLPAWIPCVADSKFAGAGARGDIEGDQGSETSH
jgi:hypothetical protein